MEYKTWSCCLSCKCLPLQTYDIQGNLQNDSQVTVSVIFENKSSSFLKSMELNVLDSLNTKMLRPEGSSIHDGIPVPFQLPPGMVSYFWGRQWGELQRDYSSNSLSQPKCVTKLWHKALLATGGDVEQTHQGASAWFCWHKQSCTIRRENLGWWMDTSPSSPEDKEKVVGVFLGREWVGGMQPEGGEWKEEPRSNT